MAEMDLQTETIPQDPSEVLTFGNGMKLGADSELEKWRGETLFTKEPETIAWIEHFSAKGRVFFDIGANVGCYSIYAAFNCRGMDVYSFEPVTDNYVTLNRNKRLNQLNNVKPFQIGLSSVSGLQTIYLSDARVGNSGAQVGQPVNEHGDQFEAVATDSLMCFSMDSLIADFGFPVPSFIKIDVDGHEFNILEGAAKTLAHPDLLSILIECNGDENQKEVDRLLGGLGFSADEKFNSLPDHSSHRRRSKSDNMASNVVYSRI